MIKVLLIDDDERHSALLKSFLRRYGMELECATEAESGLAMLQRSQPNLLILDVMLPGRDGFEICREVRKSNDIPIIMLTARGDLTDKVSGLELGADDYIGKPFEPRELVARIQTILRRIETRPVAKNHLLQFEGMQIDSNTRTVIVDDELVELTSMEYELLSLLARRAGEKLSRDQILSELRGIDAAILTRAVDIMISRVRQKIGDSAKPARFIQTAWGRGYVFVGRPVQT